jgi:hypothetical protein
MARFVMKNVNSDSGDERKPIARYKVIHIGILSHFLSGLLVSRQWSGLPWMHGR